MLNPWILFKHKGLFPNVELRQYDSCITVKFNTEGYANEHTTLGWIKDQLLPALHRINLDNRPISLVARLPTGTPLNASNVLGLIAFNTACFHKTAKVLSTLKETNITPSIIPGGCTSLI